MSNWVRRVSKLFSSDVPRAVVPEAAVAKALPPARAAAAAAPAPVETAATLPPDRDEALFHWLLDLPPGAHEALSADESAWLAEVDALIEADKAKGELLPRAAGVIPPLMQSLRDEGTSSSELSQRLQRDPNLVAEVTRVANSTAFRGAAPVTELSDAVQRVGTAGVRQAIAKVVLKPLFDAQQGRLSSRASTRLWSHSQGQADVCRALSIARGGDAFEGYLGGLLHDIGWTAGLRALERAIEARPPQGEPAFGVAFKGAFRERRDRLFVQFVTAWKLNPALHAAARDVQRVGRFDGTTDPLAQVLHAGERLATARLLDPVGLQETLATWPTPVQAAVEAIR